MHRARIDVQVIERNVRKIFRDTRDGLSPQLRRLEHVCFIDRGTLPRRFCAAAKATRATRSISSTEYCIVLLATVVPFVLVKPLGSPKYRPPSSSRTNRMSAPRTTSLRNGEQSSIAAYEIAGRRFA